MRNQLIEIIISYLDDPMRPRRRRKRLLEIATLACKHFPGDLVEIGAHVGKTTIKLLEVAKRYNRRVLVVDPWKPGTPGCRGRELGIFMDRTKPCRKILDVLRRSSFELEAIAIMKRRKIAFALVDGLHTFDACYSDIMSVSHAGVICVDDILQIDQVHKAFIDGCAKLKREAIEHRADGFREGYIIEPDKDILISTASVIGQNTILVVSLG